MIAANQSTTESRDVGAAYARRSKQDVGQYRRPNRGCENQFGVEASDVIRQMDGAGGDVASQRPEIGLPISRVGVRRAAIPVTVADPLTPHRACTLCAGIQVETTLAGDKRGIHVSRIGDCIARSVMSRTHEGLLAYATELAQQVAGAQGETTCRVDVTAPYTYAEDVTGWCAAKDKLSLEPLTLSASTIHGGARHGFRCFGTKFTHMTACPCVQSAYGTALDLRSAPNHPPLIAHSQRCETLIRFDGLKPAAAPRLADVLRTIDSVFCRTQDTLPREYELMLVHRAHSEATFAEDVVRRAGKVFEKTFRDLLRHDCGTVVIGTTSQESIHSSDLFAEITVPVARC